MVSDRWHHASYHGSDLVYLLHQFVKLLGVQGLDAIGHGPVGVVVDFNDQSVRAHGDGSARQWRDLVAFAGAMAGIDHNGKVAEPLYSRHDAEVESIAGVVSEGTDSALAQDHFVIALAHHVLGCHKEFFKSSGHAALEQHRNAGAPRPLEQGIVLHVAGADLDHVGIFFHELHGFVVDGLGDNLHAEPVTNFSHDLQAGFAQALEGIGRGAWLVCAATKELRAGAEHLLGHGHGLVVILNGAGTRNDGQARSAESSIRARKRYDGVFGLDVSADQFVGLADADEFLHPRHFVQGAGFDFAAVSRDADGGALRTRHGVSPVSQFFNLAANGADLLLGGLRLHHD